MPTLPGTATFYGGDFESNIYLRKGDPLPPASSLKSIVSIAAADESVSAAITVTGSETPTYKGAITLNSGANASGGSTVILTGRTVGADTASIEVGTNGQTNLLRIAGAEGLSQVNDPIYNPATAQELAVLLGPSPSANHPGGWLTDSPNPGVLFTSGGTAPFSVSKTGLYFLQATLYMPEGTSGSSAFTSAFTARLSATPFTQVGGVVMQSVSVITPSDDIDAYYTWGSYIPLTASTQYQIDLRAAAGGGVFFGANADLSLRLINIA
jgi:hypothetical protein